PLDTLNKTLDGLFPTAKVIGGYDFVGEIWPNGPQVWMTVSGAAGQTLNESVLAVTAPIKATLPVRQNSLSTSSARPNAVWYAVQVGTFRNRDNAERL